MIKTHAELQREHYRMVDTNPEYRLAGMMDCLREEFSLSMSYPSGPEISTFESSLTPNRKGGGEGRTKGWDHGWGTVLDNNDALIEGGKVESIRQEMSAFMRFTNERLGKMEARQRKYYQEQHESEF